MVHNVYDVVHMQAFGVTCIHMYNLYAHARIAKGLEMIPSSKYLRTFMGFILERNW